MKSIKDSEEIGALHAGKILEERKDADGRRLL
jgi:hypothetical protein